MNNVEIVRQFNEALNRGDIETMMRLMSEQCVFENTSPAPDGMRYEGQAAVRDFWENFFRDSAQATIEVEEIFAHDNRCIMRWIYRWVDLEGKAGHIRGVDVYKLEDGLIIEKLSYVKG